MRRRWLFISLCPTGTLGLLCIIAPAVESADRGGPAPPAGERTAALVRRAGGAAHGGTENDALHPGKLCTSPFHASEVHDVVVYSSLRGMPFRPSIAGAIPPLVPAFAGLHVSLLSV